jgi:hypothetical protein
LQAEAQVADVRTIAKACVHRDAEGNILQTWDREVPELTDLTAMVNTLADEVKGKGKLPKPRQAVDKGLLCELPIVDLHYGKYCWSGETGQDWDTALAAEAALQTTSDLLKRVGSVDRIVIPVLGDFFHADNRNGVTEGSGHILDVETRFQNVTKTGVELMHDIISGCTKHTNDVHVVIVPGNHDPHSAWWMSVVLDAYYSKCDGVAVDLSPRPRKYMPWGECLLGWAHGMGPKLKDWVSIMAVEQPKMWSDSKHRTWHLGHIHRGKSLQPVQVDTEVGCTVEFLNALTATDAWHNEQGYVNPIRRGEAFVWHKLNGLMARYFSCV